MEKNKNRKTYSIAVIGGGAGGIFSATTASFFGYSTCLIEQNEFLGGQPIQLYPNKFVYDYPGKIKSTSKLIISELVSQLEHTDTKIYLNTVIKKIEKEDEKFIITLNDDSEIMATYLIIATGIGNFTPKKIDETKTKNLSEKVQSKIIYSVAVDESIYKNKKIVVLGGGDSAVDWANHFVEEDISSKVAIIHRNSEYRSGSIGVGKLEKNKIKQFLDFDIVSIDEKILTIVNNVSHKIQKVEFDYILVQYGQDFVANQINFFSEIKTNEIKKIIVDQNQKTNIENVYAVGDCTFYPHKPNTIITATSDGTRAIWDIHKTAKEKSNYGAEKK